MNNKPKNVVFELFNIKRIKKDSENKVINIEDIDEGISDLDEEQPC